MDGDLESNKTERVLSEQDLATASYLTFMFAQGDFGLQTDLVNWVKQYYGKQDESDVKVMIKNFSEKLFKDKIAKLEVQNSHAEGMITKDSVEAQVQFLEGLYEERTSEIDISKVARSLVGLDLMYLENGRPNRKPDAPRNTLKEAHFSFCVTYIINGEKTGDVAFDELCKKIKSELLADNRLGMLIDLYNKSHPETTVFHEKIDSY